MGKKLLIVESPAKVKTISGFLGKDYHVMASVGHVRDLPQGKKTRTAAAKKTDKTPKDEAQKRIDRLGFDPEGDWEAHYEIIPGKEKVVKALREAAKEADSIILATDLDREGEAIAWHVKSLLSGGAKHFERIRFSEITKNAINQALSKPDSINEKRVDAYRARRFLDRLVGFEVSPILWRKLGPNLSAGRVQSVALRLLSEREREIRRFKPTPYWRVFMQAELEGGPLRLELVSAFSKAAPLTAEAELEPVLEACHKGAFSVSEVKETDEKSNPQPPFITASLQRAALTRLGFGVKRTMGVAQKLYEQGFITYMRTDAVAVSDEAMRSVRGYIEKNFGQPYLPKAPNRYNAKATAQEAHECIRPTDISLEHPRGLSEEELKLYQLIRSRFIASQMTPARYAAMSISITDKKGEVVFKANGRRRVFDGYTTIYGGGDEDVLLPEAREGEAISKPEFESSKHFTKPSPRFNEASLVSELEKRGIGRPSTYASIISTLVDRGYAIVDRRRFFVTPLGEMVSALLLGSFSELFAYDFTANLEEELDQISEGAADWKGLLNRFYQELKTEVKEASERRVKFHQSALPKEEFPCPKCGRELLIRFSASGGYFLGCSGYGETGENKCTQTLPLLPLSEAMPSEESEAVALREGRECPECHSRMIPLLLPDGAHRLFVCSDYPFFCQGFVLERGEFSDLLPVQTASDFGCQKCGTLLGLKNGRFGAYFECESCNAKYKQLSDGTPAMAPIDLPEMPCEKAKDHYMLREGDGGLFLAASTYPKVREIKKPSVGLLRRLKEQIPERLHFFLELPDEDEEGRELEVDRSRKGRDWIAYARTSEGKRAKGLWTYSTEEKRWNHEASAAEEPERPARGRRFSRAKKA